MEEVKFVMKTYKIKKIVTPFDGLNMFSSTVQYAVFIAKRCNAQITDVFLSEFTQVGYAVYAALEEHGSANCIFGEQRLNTEKEDFFTIQEASELAPVSNEKNAAIMESVCSLDPDKCVAIPEEIVV